jgi:hypothetical protein
MHFAGLLVSRPTATACSTGQRDSSLKNEYEIHRRDLDVRARSGGAAGRLEQWRFGGARLSNCSVSCTLERQIATGMGHLAVRVQLGRTPRLTERLVGKPEVTIERAVYPRCSAN